MSCLDLWWEDEPSDTSYQGIGERKMFTPLYLENNCLLWPDTGKSKYCPVVITRKHNTIIVIAFYYKISFISLPLYYDKIMFV